MNYFQMLREGQGPYKLICFPYLGGYANSFIDLSNELSKKIEIWSVNFPGHGASKEKPFEDISQLTSVLVNEVSSLIDENVIFFGHSMGGIVSYHLVRHLLENNMHIPKKLILSACNSPYDFNNKHYSKLSDGELLSHILSYGGVPEDIQQGTNLLQYFLPIFRADFKVLESSAKLEKNPIDIDSYFFWAEQDEVVSIDSSLLWSQYFSDGINIVPIRNGDHMYIQGQLPLLTKNLENIFFERGMQ